MKTGKTRPFSPAAYEKRMAGLHARAVVVKDARLLMVRCRRKGKEYLCLPGSPVRKKEEPADALVRALKEKYGLNAFVVPGASLVEHGSVGCRYTFSVSLQKSSHRRTDPLEAAMGGTHAGLAWVSLADGIFKKNGLLPEEILQILPFLETPWALDKTGKKSHRLMPRLNANRMVLHFPALQIEGVI